MLKGKIFLMAALILFSAMALTGCDTEPGNGDDNGNGYGNGNGNGSDLPDGTKVVSYIRTWHIPEAMREGTNRYWTANMVKGEYLTDLMIAFAIIQSDNTTIAIPETSGSNPFNIWGEINALKTKYPHLRINLSIGGGGNSDRFPPMAADPVLRAKFIENVCMWMELRNLNGADIDWEYPVGSGGQRPADRDNYIILLQEMRNALDELGKKTGKRYGLSTAIPATSWFLQRNRVADAAKIVDYLKVMTYDYYGDWSSRTGHHTSLFRNTSDNQGWDTKRALDLYLAAGIPKEKLMIGFGFYGWGWADVQPGSNASAPGLFQTATARSIHTGDITGGSSTTRSLAYTDIKEHVLKPGSGYTRYWDDVAKAPWLYNATTNRFITYSDAQQVQAIAEFVKEQGMKGVFVWEYGNDLSSELLKVLYETMHQEGDDE